MALHVPVLSIVAANKKVELIPDLSGLVERKKHMLTTKQTCDHFTLIKRRRR